MIDTTKEYYGEDVINSLLEEHVPKIPQPFYNLIWKKSKKILDNYRIYELSSINDLVENYDVLNKKTRLGMFARFGLSKNNNKNNTSNTSHTKKSISPEEIILYNQFSKLERKSYSKNLNYALLENVCVNIVDESFVKKDFFEACEIELFENIESDTYMPANFLFKDKISGLEKDNLKNSAMLEIILESNPQSKYDITIQTMDEDYEINNKGIRLCRGKRLLIKDINIHDDERYIIPDYEPLLTSVFR